MSRARPRLRIGILSTAKIAGEFIKGVRASDRIEVTAVASRDPYRARRFAREHGIADACDSYESLLADRSVQAVYNPLPNALHAEWSIKALQAGKHVLCEKPLAIDAAQARSMFEAASRAKRHLVEAYPYLAQPLTMRLRRMLDAGEIGPIRTIQASFGFPMPSSGNIRLDRALGGGALFDAGCYPVSLVRVLAGDCPVGVQASSSWASAGVDSSTSATFEFANGVRAQISCGFGVAVHRFALIAATRGVIETNYWNSPPVHRPATMLVRRGAGWDAGDRFEPVEAPALNGFQAEAESFCDLIAGEEPRWTGATQAESVDIARMIEAVKRSANSGNTEKIST